MDPVLVLNAGSSSIKFAAFAPGTSPSELIAVCHGHVAQVGTEVVLRVATADGTVLEDTHRASGHDAFAHDLAIAQLMTWLDDHEGGLRPAAVGHRVVHGGACYSTPVTVTDEVLRDLDALVPLAPLHQPHNLAAIRVVRERWPAVAQVACFDTAFHATQPRVARAFALPREIASAGVRRYGFHGLSYEYISTQLPRVLGDRAGGKVVVAHLGNGASLCALVDRRSVASTMGFSALDGLMMGTRCGTLDAGVVLHLLQHRGMSAQEISDLLYSRSGLLGVSGISSDMQVLLTSPHPHAAEAVDLFVYRIVVEIGALAAAMGGIDALVFTAGIGEHAAPIRARVCRGCEWLGAVLDEAANRDGCELIHTQESAVRLAVVPTDEEKMIAAHTLGVLGV